jgi:predicted nucleotide-binding protein (sugar kinase/HSP70/actin superfamily)
MNDRVITPRRLPIIGQDIDLDADIEAELANFEAQERARLGIEDEAIDYWADDMIDLTIKKSQIAQTTLLLGGLPRLADILIQSALKPLGYDVQYLPEPNHESLRYGKEFGNRAQCNPTYYTVGNLVRFLCELRDRGMSEEEIVSKYAFISAGSCGPCRFGMYVTEYRKALRDAGFEGFRIMLFEEKGGISQETEEDAGIEFSPKFFLQLAKAVYAADILNGIGYRLRPYEVTDGSMQEALEDCKRICCEILEKDGSILWALHKSKNRLGQVPIDRTQIKPKVAIMGEFWAQMTEGEGNYRVKQFLEEEGAEVRIQFVSEWLLYNVWEEKRDMELRVGMRGHDTGTARSQDEMGTYGIFKRRLGLWAFDRGMRAIFQTFAKAAGFNDYQTGDVDEARVTAAKYYSSELRGGEGHMEVAHLVDNYTKKKANMTLSVKPFGCLPSSAVSDGVVSKVLEEYPGAILASIETSGDGAVNFYSRVQLYLFKAREAAEAEVQKALDECGLTMEQVRAHLKKHPELDDPFHPPPHVAACTSADMVYHVSHHMKTSRLQRARERGQRIAQTTRGRVQRARAGAPGFISNSRQFARELRVTAVEAARAKVDGKLGTNLAAKNVGANV